MSIVPASASYLVTWAGTTENFGTAADTVDRANELRRAASAGVAALCFERTAAYESRQRVWPTAGPAYTASH